MLGYNGSIPGPTLHVRQGSEVIVHVTNDGDLETTVHWHGLRLENRYDGVPHETQRPIPSGAASPTASSSPTPACTGTTRTSARTTPRRWACTATSSSSPPNRTTGRRPTATLVLTLDDLLVEDGKIAPFCRSGDQLHGDGPVRQRDAGRRRDRLSADRRERARCVRLWLTNTANTRVFNVALPGARMKLVGGDSGRVEHEEFVAEVMLAPSERAVVDVLFDQPGQLALEHRTPDRTYRLGAIAVTEERAAPSLADEFEQLRTGAGAGRRAAAAGRAGWPRSRTRSSPWSPRWTTPCGP